jgi:hypothetical protein
LQDWGEAELENYALDQKQSEIRPTLAFIAMAIITLLIFLLW